ncbi:ABC transporter substrate-binding protein [Pigmentiphaga soli]|uniref:ABC transporter substrate-binding protein n=1 Tax=Pigmentiphaga soli TaxID=1007095 RepID=A0ABP8H9N5_9BURK
MNRKHLLSKKLMAVAAAALLAGGAGAARAGQFDGVTVKVATFGGKWRDIVDQYVGKPFEAEGGKVEYVLGQPAQNMAKLIAARGQPAPFDMMETMDNFLPALARGGFTELLNEAAIPNLANLPASAHDKNKVMIWATQEGIVYNKEKFKEAGIPAPVHYADLADPRLKGKVSVPDISAGGAIPAIVGMSLEAGGNEANIGPGLDLIQKIAPASFWSSSSNLQTQLTNGDVWAAAAQAGNVQRLKQVPLGMTHVPVAGKVGILKQGYLVKIKGTKQSAAVDWIINRFLSLPMQMATSTEGGQVPTSKAALAEMQKDKSLSFMKLSPEEVAGMYQIDYSKVDQAAYVQQWNRKIGSK